MITKPKNIDEYIGDYPDAVQARLRQMRKVILSVAPGATEGLKWSMPSFSYHRILVNFAAFKNHIGFYPTPSAIEKFENELSGYTHAKGSIQFPNDKPLPLSLVKKITKYRVKQERENDVKWKS